MATNPRIHVRISETNRRRLVQFAGDHNLNMGALVDEALSLFFRPPEERSEATLLGRINLVEDQIERLEGASAFQTDLLIEYIFEWLRQRPPANPLLTPADEARAKTELEALTKRVVERSNPHLWN